jgi:hypothetical protein
MTGELWREAQSLQYKASAMADWTPNRAMWIEKFIEGRVQGHNVDSSGLLETRLHMIERLFVCLTPAACRAGEIEEGVEEKLAEQHARSGSCTQRLSSTSSPVPRGLHPHLLCRVMTAPDRDDHARCTPRTPRCNCGRDSGARRARALPAWSLPARRVVRALWALLGGLPALGAHQFLFPQ